MPIAPAFALDDIAAAIITRISTPAPRNTKGLAVALHYRANPAIGPNLARCVHSTAEELGPAVHVQEGASVCEIKPTAAIKRTAVETFLAEPPF